MGTETLQRMHCNGLGDQVLPVIKDLISRGCLGKCPGQPSLSHPGTGGDGSPAGAASECWAPVPHSGKDSVQATGLRLGDCQPSFLARTTPAAPPAYWLLGVVGRADSRTVLALSPAQRQMWYTLVRGLFLAAGWGEQSC